MVKGPSYAVSSAPSRLTRIVAPSGVALKLAVGTLVNQPLPEGSSGASVSVVTGASGGGGGVGSATATSATCESFSLPAASVAMARSTSSPAATSGIVAVVSP